MSLRGATELLKDLPDEERKEFCERVLGRLSREYDSTATFCIAAVAVILIVYGVFLYLTWGEKLVSPFWLGGRRW